MYITGIETRQLTLTIFIKRVYIYIASLQFNIVIFNFSAYESTFNLLSIPMCYVSVPRMEHNVIHWFYILGILLNIISSEMLQM